MQVPTNLNLDAADAQSKRNFGVLLRVGRWGFCALIGYLAIEVCRGLTPAGWVGLVALAAGLGVLRLACHRYRSFKRSLAHPGKSQLRRFLSHLGHALTVIACMAAGARLYRTWPTHRGEALGGLAALAVLAYVAVDDAATDYWERRWRKPGHAPDGAPPR